MHVPQRSWPLGVHRAGGASSSQRVHRHTGSPDRTCGLRARGIQLGPAQTHNVSAFIHLPIHLLIHPTIFIVTHSLMPRPAPLSEHVRTVLLPVAGCAVAEGTYCLMYGWGDTKGSILYYSATLSTFTCAPLMGLFPMIRIRLYCSKMFICLFIVSKYFTYYLILNHINSITISINNVVNVKLFISVLFLGWKPKN